LGGGVGGGRGEILAFGNTFSLVLSDLLVG